MNGRKKSDHFFLTNLVYYFLDIDKNLSYIFDIFGREQTNKIFYFSHLISIDPNDLFLFWSMYTDFSFYTTALFTELLISISKMIINEMKSNEKYGIKSRHNSRIIAYIFNLSYYFIIKKNYYLTKLTTSLHEMEQIIQELLTLWLIADFIQLKGEEKNYEKWVKHFILKSIHYYVNFIDWHTNKTNVDLKTACIFFVVASINFFFPTHSYIYIYFFDIIITLHAFDSIQRSDSC